MEIPVCLQPKMFLWLQLWNKTLELRIIFVPQQPWWNQNQPLPLPTKTLLEAAAWAGRDGCLTKSVKQGVSSFVRAHLRANPWGQHTTLDGKLNIQTHLANPHRKIKLWSSTCSNLPGNRALIHRNRRLLWPPRQPDDHLCNNWPQEPGLD